ncbi:MAG: hypothetical protein NAOJABEB_02981 [Steroidobacteraceae bacterium]|nr:hypothetical protein [Steroidobacteraceae bacterium]
MSQNHSVQITIRAANLSEPAFAALVGDLKGISAQAESTTTHLKQIDAAARGAGGGFMSSASQIIGFGGAIGVAQAATQSILGGLRGAASGLLHMNQEVENTRARLVAFTGSGEAADRILADLQREAAQTPFTFRELSTAVASLIPASKQSGEALNDLIDVAEVLAASNPAEGLEGAAFSLREALSGDFQSVIDRFNLSRQAINDLKAQGLPALEVISQALSQMGLNMSVVSGLAETTSGRMSTLTDRFELAALAISKPWFEQFTKGLEGAIQATDGADFQSRIDRWSAASEGLAEAFGQIATVALPPLVDALNEAASQLSEVSTNAQFAAGVVADGTSRWKAFDDALAGVPGHLAAITLTLAAQSAKEVLGVQFIEDQWKRAAIARDLYYKLPFTTSPADREREAAALAIQQAEKERVRELNSEIDKSEAATAAAAEAFYSYAHGVAAAGAAADDTAPTIERLTSASIEAAQAQAEAVALQGRDAHVTAESMQEYTRAQSEAAFATDKLTEAQHGLAEAYQTGLSIQAQYASQQGEYQGQLSSLENAYEAIQQKQADGIALSQDEQNLLRDYPGLYARLEGGVQDATIAQGLWAAQNTRLMTVQDQLNQQFPNLVEGSEEWRKKMMEVGLSLGYTEGDMNTMLDSAGGLQGAIAGPGGLTEAINSLIDLLGKVVSPDPLEITAKDEASEVIKGIVEDWNNTHVSLVVDTIGAEPGRGGGLDSSGGGPGRTPPDMSNNGPSGARQNSGLGTTQLQSVGDTQVPFWGKDDLQSARDALSSAQDYAGLIDQLVTALGEIAEREGDGIESAKAYAEAAKTVLDTYAAAVQFVKDLGDTLILWGGWQQDAIGNLKLLTEYAVTASGQSAALFEGDYLDHISTYADAAKSALDVMSGALQFVKDLGDTVVIWGNWQREAEDVLKLVAEHAVKDIGESAAVYSGPYLDGIQEYADAAGAALDVLSDALSFVVDLADAADDMRMSQREIAARAHSLAGDARIVADEFAAAAEDWDSTATPAVSDLADAVSASSGALSDTVGFLADLADLAEQTDGAQVNARALGAYAHRLSADARIIADEFAAAAADWDGTINPAVSDFAEAAGDSLDTIKAVPDALEAILNFGNAQKRPDVAGLASQMAADIKAMTDALVLIAEEYTPQQIEALTTFADGAGEGLSLVGDAADALASIAEMGKLSAGQLGNFHDNFLAMLAMTRQLVAEGEQYLDDVLAFKTLAEAAAEGWQAAADAMQSAGASANEASAAVGGIQHGLAGLGNIGSGGGGLGSVGGGGNMGGKGGGFDGTPTPEPPPDPTFDDFISALVGFTATADQLSDVIDIVTEGDPTTNDDDVTSYAADQLALLQQIQQNPEDWPEGAAQAVGDQLAASLADLGILGMSQADFVNTLLGAVGVSPLATMATDVAASVGQAITDANSVMVGKLADALEQSLSRAGGQMATQVAQAVERAVRTSLAGVI